MRHLATQDLATLRDLARSSPRRRAHLLLHTTPTDAQRIVIALEPGSYIRPHLHPSRPDWNGDETLAVLSGTIAVLIFTNDGHLLSRTVIQTGHLCHIPGGEGHAIAALATGTVIIETKQGGRPDPDRTWLPGFPAEDNPEARSVAADWSQ